MLKTITLLLTLCLVHASDAQTILSRVTFPIDEFQSRSDLAKAGLDLSHGHVFSKTSFTTEVQDFQLTRFDELGIRYQIDIADLSTYRKELQSHETRGNFLECQDHAFDPVVPKNFEYGSIGGFYSLPEVLDQLDVMAFLYPSLISVRKPIGDIKTWQDKNIFWVKISKNPEVEENEPKILYTSLHHSREFVSVSQTIYYMWYLLENYSKSPVIKQILDNTELYFVPVVNPDGLDYNVAGYNAQDDVFTRNLRKNMRDNDNNGLFDPAVDGVDLNRNYGYAWGYDDEGSSGFTGSDTYRGPSAFSEPETQAIQFLCNNNDFKIALNYHAYGNVLIYPWGYNDKSTQDSSLFSNYGEIMTKLNRYVYGTGTETVDYVTNGDSDDWMYGEQGIFSMTPEVGDSEDGFYPPKHRIIPLCQSTLELNIVAARLVNSLIEITDESPKYIQTGVNELELGFSRYGLLEGEVLVSFKALSPHVLEVPSSIMLNLDQFESHERLLNFTIDPAIGYGSKVKIEIVCQQGAYTYRDTITKIRADFESIVTDDGDMSNWNTTAGMKWGTTTADFKSGPVSITDSPMGQYAPNANEVILLDQFVNLNQASAAYVQFWAKWDLEDYYDYVVFQVSTNGTSWTNLCGDQSNLGSLFQLYEQPLYDGKQVHWVLENVDLSDYLGKTIQLRFMLVSDGFVHRDGFYFDNFKVITIQGGAVATKDLDAGSFSVFPNPADNDFTVKWNELVKPSIAVYNSLGRLMHADVKLYGDRLKVSTAQWPTGLYHYQILSDRLPVYSGTLSVMR